MAVYKSKVEADAQAIAQRLQNGLDAKYKIYVKKADSGATKFLTGNTVDTVRIRKNGYHGVAISFMKDPEGHTVLSTYTFRPNMIIEAITRKAGLLDILIFKAIWGGADKFHSHIDERITNELEAEEVDMSIKAGLKKMFGKGEKE